MNLDYVVNPVGARHTVTSAGVSCSWHLLDTCWAAKEMCAVVSGHLTVPFDPPDLPDPLEPLCSAVA
eukprot:gene12636-2601_t